MCACRQWCRNIPTRASARRSMHPMTTPLSRSRHSTVWPMTWAVREAPTAALADALGRLISLNLRILSPLSQSDRVQEIVDQLRGIGGSRSVGFGMQQIRSLPDAVARALELHLESVQPKEETASPSQNGNVVENGKHVDAPSPLSLGTLTVTGNLCPQ